MDCRKGQAAAASVRNQKRRIFFLDRLPEIRELLAQGYSQKKIAKHFGINVSTVEGGIEKIPELKQAFDEETQKYRQHTEDVKTAQIRMCEGECGKTLPFSEFYQDQTSRFGVQNKCKMCQCNLAKARKEVIREQNVSSPINSDHLELFCFYCKTTKSANDFHRDSGRLNGHVAHCKTCIASLKKRDRGTRLKEDSVTYKMKSILEAAKQRAKVQGVPISITQEDLRALYVEKCPFLGIPIVWANTGKIVDGSPSLDKIIPELGYVAGNSIIISYRANVLKRDATVEELTLISEALQRLVWKSTVAEMLL